jgi:hypothetical protein
MGSQTPQKCFIGIAKRAFCRFAGATETAGGINANVDSVAQ